MGIEEVCSYFHLGLEASVSRNSVAELGVPTCRTFSRDVPVSVKTIQAVNAIPSGYGRIHTVERNGNGVVVISESGEKVQVPIDLDFLR